MSWIAGSWENSSDSSVFYEMWEKVNDSVLKGEAYVIEGGETVFSEKIAIEKKENDIFYIAGVSGQNEGEPVPFKLVSSSETEFAFENKEHDFPNRIVYSKISGDSLVARIEGKRDGKEHTEYFPLKRRKTE